MSDNEFAMMLKRGEEAMSEKIDTHTNPVDVVPSDPFSKQVGGNHYKQYAIQPYEFFYKSILNKTLFLS